MISFVSTGGSSISLDVPLLGGGLTLLTGKDPGQERAELFEFLELSGRTRLDVLHVACDVSGIRVDRDLHDEGAVGGQNGHLGYAARRCSASHEIGLKKFGNIG